MNLIAVVLTLLLAISLVCLFLLVKDIADAHSELVKLQQKQKEGAMTKTLNRGSVMKNKLIKTPFTHVRPLRPMGHTRRSWIRERLENGGYKTHSNFSLLRLLNKQYREIESLKEQS